MINDDDKTFAGSYTPKNTFSFGGSLNWKGFDFSFFFQGVTGNKVYNGLKQMAMNGRNDYGNLISDVFNSWDFDPQGSKYPVWAWLRAAIRTVTTANSPTYSSKTATTCA